MGGSTGSFDRRKLLLRTAAAAVAGFIARPAWGSAAGDPIRFALTPVFLTSDLELLERLKSYLEAATGRPVQLVTRRTYQEITALLVSGQVDGGLDLRLSVCRLRAQLALVAVPVWRGKPLYQSYLIADARTEAPSIDDLAGDIHAFSDPDSNSGFLVTAAELARRARRRRGSFGRRSSPTGSATWCGRLRPDWRRAAVSTAMSMRCCGEVEPKLTKRTRLVALRTGTPFRRSPAPRQRSHRRRPPGCTGALLRCTRTPRAGKCCALLRLDGFERSTALPVRLDRRQHEPGAGSRMMLLETLRRHLPITVKVPVVVVALMVAIGVIAPSGCCAARRDAGTPAQRPRHRLSRRAGVAARRARAPRGFLGDLRHPRSGAPPLCRGAAGRNGRHRLPTAWFWRRRTRATRRSASTLPSDFPAGEEHMSKVFVRENDSRAFVDRKTGRRGPGRSERSTPSSTSRRFSPNGARFSGP